MLVLVNNDEVAGETNTEVGLPAGFTIHKVDATSLDSLYYDSIKKTVLVKPEKPSDLAYWVKDHWEEPTAPTILVAPIPMTENQVAIAIHEILYKKDPVVAGAIAYLLARLEGDNTVAGSAFDALKKIATEYLLNKQ